MRCIRTLLAAGIAALTVLGGIPRAATAQVIDYCSEAWVIRNMIFDRLGHCFGSAAGQALFDNSDCTVSGPTLPPALTRVVNAIRESEQFVGCRIDTSQAPSPAMVSVRDRMSRFIDLPVPDHVGGFACWGYRGQPFEVRLGASLAAPVVGVVRQGQSVVSTYFNMIDGWVFVDVVTGPGGDTINGGWASNLSFYSAANCEQVAG